MESIYILQIDMISKYRLTYYINFKLSRTIDIRHRSLYMSEFHIGYSLHCTCSLRFNYIELGTI